MAEQANVIQIPPGIIGHCRLGKGDKGLVHVASGRRNDHISDAPVLPRQRRDLNVRDGMHTQNTTQDLYVVHARTDLCKQIGTCARARTHTTQACVYVCARATSVLVYVCECSERHTCRYTRNMLRSCGHLLAQPIDRHIQREAINHNSARASAVLYQGLLGSVLTAPIWSGRHPAWMPSVAYLPRNCASATCPAVLSSTMTPLDPGSTRRQCTRLIRH